MKSIKTSLSYIAVGTALPTASALAAPTRAGVDTDLNLFEWIKRFFELADLGVAMLFTGAFVGGIAFVIYGVWSLRKTMKLQENDPNKRPGLWIGTIFLGFLLLGAGTLIGVGTNTVNEDDPQAEEYETGF